MTEATTVVCKWHTSDLVCHIIKRFTLKHDTSRNSVLTTNEGFNHHQLMYPAVQIIVGNFIFSYYKFHVSGNFKLIKPATYMLCDGDYPIYRTLQKHQDARQRKSKC